MCGAAKGTFSIAATVATTISNTTTNSNNWAQREGKVHTSRQCQGNEK